MFKDFLQLLLVSFLLGAKISAAQTTTVDWQSQFSQKMAELDSAASVTDTTFTDPDDLLNRLEMPSEKSGIELDDANIAADALATIEVEVKIVSKNNKHFNLQTCSRSGPYQDSEEASHLYWGLKTETGSWETSPETFNRSEGEVSETAYLKMSVEILQTGRYKITKTKTGEKSLVERFENAIEVVIKEWAAFTKTPKQQSLTEKLWPF